MGCSIVLETERLTIRPFVPADLDDLYGQLSDPEVMRYYPSVLTREGAEKWFQQIMRDYEEHGHGQLAIRLKKTGEYIGQAGIMRRMINGCEHFYLAYLLRKEFWGQGYATEAASAIVAYGFETLGLSQVEALIRPENTASIRLAERLDMCFESTTQHAGFEHRVYVLSRRTSP